MISWILTTSSADGERVTMGSAADPHRARRDLVTAARTQIRYAPAGTPRYTLHQDGVTVAIIQTGLTEAGTPDHAGATDMLDRVDHPRNPFEV
jgi:hypothetical protein